MSSAGFSSDGAACVARELPGAPPPLPPPPLSPLREHEVEATCRWITDHSYTKVCLQFPDVMLGISTQIYEAINSNVKADIFILGDTTYSSCCVDEIAAMHVNADAVVHYGHYCFSSCSIPVYVVLPKQHIEVELITALEGYFKDDISVKLCLFYDAAYHYLKDEISEIWFKIYPHSCIAFVELMESEDRIMGRCVQDKYGKTMKLTYLEDLTCIYLGSRSQTLFNCVISIKAREWHCLDPENKQASILNEAPWFRRRRYLIEKCKDADKVGILICKLSGQTTKDIIKSVQDICRKSGKKSYIISVGKPNVAKLANFPEIDLYVMIACPENDLYSSREFYKPLVYPYELELALNINRTLPDNIYVPNFEDLLPQKRAHCSFSATENRTDISLITGRIRDYSLLEEPNKGLELEQTKWALDVFGSNLQNRSWTGLEQNLGETEVKLAEKGRSGLPISYKNEPK